MAVFVCGYRDFRQISYGCPVIRRLFLLFRTITNVIVLAATVRLGVVPVAAAYVIGGYVFAPVDLWMVRKVVHIDVRKYLRQYVPALVGCATMALSLYLTTPYLRVYFDTPATVLAVSVALGGATYGLVLYVLGVESVKDLTRAATEALKK